MPKCRFCHENITKFDKEICPFCGGKDPLNGPQESTNNITQTVLIMEENQLKGYKQKSLKTNAFLCMFLGFFSADAFYRGYFINAAIRLMINLSVFIAIFSLLFFLPTGIPLVFAILIAFILPFLFYLILGITLLNKKGIRDKKGANLK